VLVVGGGYTGLWTAYHLTELAPAVDVVVLEQDICGGGASGRNGGFVTGWWDELSRLVDLFGERGGVEVSRAAGRSVRAIGEFCQRHGIDAWYRRAGYLMVAAATAQEGAVDEAVAVARRRSVERELVPLSPEAIRARCNSPVFGRGALMRDGATVQPARLARGLRRVLLDRGVRIFEGTRVRGLRTGDPCVAQTPRGSVRARSSVLAVNAWGVAWPVLRRLTVARGSYMVLTEPIPDRLEQLGWTGGECITDLRTAVHYFRTTDDGRIAFGGGGASVGLGRRMGRTFTHDRAAVARTVEGFHRLFPDLADAALVEAWGGAVDVGPVHVPVFARAGRGRVFLAVGYTGNGVGPSELAGRILARRCLDVEDECTALPIASHRPRRYPPEPFRSVGGRIINAAVVRRDRQMEQRGRPGGVTDFLARLPSRVGYRLPPE
jgi:glycine/D-amino acid oxidase-like deaminating enzyme